MNGTFTSDARLNEIKQDLKDVMDQSVKEPEPSEYDKLKAQPIGVIVETFAATRDYLKEERRKFKELEAETKADLEMMETLLLDKQRELGVRSISTENYTAFQNKKTSVRMGDWDTFSEWVLETGNIHCIEKRCAKLACLEIEEGAESGKKVDLASIGLEKTEEIVVQVRKK